MVEINVARLIGATEECACGQSGSQPPLSSPSFHQTSRFTERIIVVIDGTRDIQIRFGFKNFHLWHLSFQTDPPSLFSPVRVERKRRHIGASDAKFRGMVSER